MVKSYTLAGTAAAICLVLAIGAVLTTFHILHDISDFYNEAQEELIEFKDIANNVWDEMVFESTPEEMREAEDLDREKRSYEEPNPYESESSSTTTTTTTSTTTASTTTTSQGDESGYDFGNDNGPPSSRPKKPMPPTMPRTIQGFRAPPPGATSTYRPPSGRNYDNYGREPASSRRPYPPYQPYQSSSTAAPHNSSSNKTPYNPPTNQQTIVYPPNQPQPRVAYNQPNYTQSPRVPYTGVPVTPPPRQPSGGYDSDRQTPPTWPKVYNTRRPTFSGPGYPEEQIPTLPPTPQQSQVPGQQRVPPTQTRNPPPPPQMQYPEHTNLRQVGGPVPPGVTTPSIDEIPAGKAGSRPGFGPQRPRFPSNTRQRSNPCDQCSAQPNTCPSGPPGPRGRPGPPGFPGQDGPRGLRGLNGGYVGIHPASYDPVIGCVQCPVGPPGDRGADGAPGYPGDDGNDGEQGTNGNDGQPGAPGAPGFPGMNGVPGAPGKPGTPGRNGQSCRSMPGPPGKPGMVGAPGRAGDPGIDGEHGQDGSPGIQGPPGRDGNPGVEGPEGTSAPGVPGTDGGYCPCPKRSSKYDFADVGFIDDERKTRPQRPREHSAEIDVEHSHRSGNYEDSEYSRRRRPIYEPSEEAPYQRNRYDEEERVKEQPKDYALEPQSRRPPPPRQSPRHQESRYSEEYERRPQESGRGYEDERSRGYPEERTKSRPEESHSSGYGGDQRKEPEYMERRPVEQPRYEINNEVPERTRPLKKIEINKTVNREYEQPRRAEYEDVRPGHGEDTRRYGTESERSFEEDAKKNVHPPGFRRPKSQEERWAHEPAAEKSLPTVKQTEKFEGEKRKKGQPEYEDISKSEGEDEKSRDKHHKKPNKFQEKQWEEHRKSQELRNSREHGGQVSAENPTPMQQVRPKEAEPMQEERQSSTEEKPVAHENAHNSEKHAFSNENPLPSEQLPYRRKTRFYRNHYYEKFLA